MIRTIASSLTFAALAATLFTVVTFSPTTAQAEQPWARRLEVGVTLGYLGLGDPNGLGNAFYVEDVASGGALIGLRLSYPILQTLAIDAELNYTPTSLPRPAKAGDDPTSASLLSYRVLARYVAMPGKKLRPFVTAGVGQMNLRADKQYVKPSDTDNAYILGAGAQLQLGYRLFARADARWIGSDARPDEKEKDANGAVAPGAKTISHDLSQNFEVSVGLSYAFGGPAQDTDGDGIPDDVDKCPTLAEDKDGFQDADGCPDPDNDGDGIPDSADKCPNVAEDKDGFQDGDGCPELDNDGDGIPDSRDKCPNAAEDKDGFEDDDGCPDPDNDGDGIPDVKDKCPNQAEDKDGYQDDDGCPDPDNDGDGIPDVKDKCPNEPEDKNGFQDEDGCPENMPAHIAPMFGKPVEGLTFRRAKLTRGAAKVLDKLLELLLEREDIKIEVHVHTHTRGKPAVLKKLSEDRAKAIIAFYVAAGIDAKRFFAMGHGGEQPVSTKRGREAKKANERVIFKIAAPVARPGR